MKPSAEDLDRPRTEARLGLRRAAGVVLAWLLLLSGLSAYSLWKWGMFMTPRLGPPVAGVASEPEGDGRIRPVAHHARDRLGGR